MEVMWWVVTPKILLVLAAFYLIVAALYAKAYLWER